jgi:hypothetical protein
MRPITIEPEQPSFKVLPENPGGPCIPHKGRAVYTRMNPGASPLIQDDENLLPPQEDPADIPVGNDEFVGGVEENLIIDDKIYYVKMSAGKNKAILEGELKLLRRRFANVLNGIETSVKKVSNPKGEQKHAILVGPFNSQDAAVEIARQIGDQCYIVSVKE